ncbi:hypothetical protein [Actinopolyspora mortivallis]|uniref:Uncharacterized protein n=1 Tax=Actinopolyspora mortivallis TaxID=33906 RepID=A0A2T0GWA7_ACTMO|nr:hypothetical protein [Actinopolyspora mortivallis]PRW63389.1 hypothetical protein CEP50_10600 [Actinopolyspora mortivallis]
MTDRETGLLCHELLLRLADRIPAESLWRYRDWLASGAEEVLAVSLPKQLLRERIGLTDTEHRLLSEALLPLGADPAAVSAVLPPESGSDGYSFTASGPTDDTADSEALVLGAALRGRAGVHEVRGSWRHDSATTVPTRVVLVDTSGDPVELTGEIQRVLRALGNHTPLVEVLPEEVEPTDYHGRARTASNLICTGNGASPVRN